MTFLENRNNYIQTNSAIIKALDYILETYQYVCNERYILNQELESELKKSKKHIFIETNVYMSTMSNIYGKDLEKMFGSVILADNFNNTLEKFNNVIKIEFNFKKKNDEYIFDYFSANIGNLINLPIILDSIPKNSQELLNEYEKICSRLF